MAPSVETQRLFVALELPGELQARLAALQSALRGAWPRLHAAWSPPDRMHLTLRFLGAVPAARVEALVGALRAAVAGRPAFELEAVGLGAFPGWRRPRVLWAGVREPGDAGRLISLQSAVQAATGSFATEAPEAVFQPHITLARVKQVPVSGALAGWARERAEDDHGRWTAGEVVLMRSELGPGGGRYTRVAGVPLGATPAV
ncbi:MAG: hypothetical protein RJA22_404 [Verrucomicrobiota bacterium]|jgi:2'-5' RNA ligase